MLPYATYKEASDAAITIGIQSYKEYQYRYKEDPRLPSRPDTIYAQDWKGFKEFLGQETKSHYPTVQEAAAAVQKLKIKSISEYNRRYKEDPRLPAVPPQKYKSTWQDWYVFFGKEAPSLYETYEDASHAAQKLGIKTAQEYLKRYKEDPRLPGLPRITYASDWKNWYAFLNTKYTTVEAINAAIKKLGISDYREYRNRHKEDPRLPSNPASFLHLDGNKVFFEQTLYSSYQEASRAAIALGIKSFSEYQKRHKEDPGLPRSPEQHYSEWVNWYAFLNKYYPTAEEAQRVVSAEGISTFAEYKLYRKSNPALPPSPAKHYGFDDFNAFIGFEYYDLTRTVAYCKEHKISNLKKYTRHRKLNPYLRKQSNIPGYTGANSILYKPTTLEKCPDAYNEWAKLGQEWCKQGRSITEKEALIQRFINWHMAENHHPISAGAFFHETHHPGNLSDFFNRLSVSSRATITLNRINDFLDYVYEKTCCEIDPITGVIEELPEYRNPFKYATIDDLDMQDTPSESTKPPLPYSYVLKAQDWLIPPNAKKLGDLSNAQNIFETDWYEVPQSVIDENDPNCVWRTQELYRKSGRRKETVYELWSPVRTIALYTLLLTPIRGQQILWLDSGEADNWMLKKDEKTNEYVWTENTGDMAGQLGSEGFLHRKQSGNSTITGMHITTNKTSRKLSGYDVPWINEKLIPWIVCLRDWQAKYNPLETPTQWKAIKLPRKVNEKILKFRDKQCFLFRDPSGKTPLEKATPLTTQQAFKHSLPATLYQVQTEELPLATKVDPKSTALSNYISAFTPHSMRVSLITAYVLDSEIAVPIISKLVGHARIVMTIYYTKVNQHEMRTVMSSAEEKMLAKSPERLKGLLLNNLIEEARSELIASDGKLLLTDDWPKAAYFFQDWGLCPYSGSRCETGGLEREIGAGYEPVSGGYLGRRNCLQCRFFITGPAFLGGLQMLANEISLECHTSALQLQKHTEKIEQLETEAYEAETLDIPFTRHSDLNKYEVIRENEAEKFDTYCTDLISVIRLANQSIKMLNANKQGPEPKTEMADKALLIVSGDVDDFSMAMKETCEFMQLDAICRNSEFYSAANPSRANARRSQLIDMMAQKNGLEPGMFALDLEQQLEVGNQLTKLLASRLQSRNKLASLMDRSLALSDIFESDNTGETRELTHLIQQLLDGETPRIELSNTTHEGATVYVS